MKLGGVSQKRSEESLGHEITESDVELHRGLAGREYSPIRSIVKRGSYILQIRNVLPSPWVAMKRCELFPEVLIAAVRHSFRPGARASAYWPWKDHMLYRLDAKCLGGGQFERTVQF